MNKQEELISIIIPIYNAEKYIERCINSLKNQTYKNIEIICINDGSTDNSLNILKRIAITDNRIKIIEQENKGVSVARNKGIESAKGKYIMFLDSDDWFELTTCEKVINEIDINNNDIVCFNYNVVERNKIYKVNDILSLKNHIPTKIPPIVCRFTCAIYNKKFLTDNKIIFPVGIKNHEDIIFSMKVFIHAKSIGTINDYLYNYFKNEESATRNFERLNSNEALTYWQKTEDYKNQCDEDKLKSIDIFAKFLFGFWSEIKSSKYKNENELIIKSFLDEYKKFKNQNLLNYTGYRRIKFKIIYKYLKIIKYFILNLRKRA